MLIRSRREFLKSSLKSVTALGAAGAMAKFGEISAFASGVGSEYQALVCIFLGGGNDGHNTVIPISTEKQNYALYQKGRQGLSLEQSTLLPINDGRDAYGLHPSLTEIQQLYTQGKAGILANVGMLVQPITRSGFQANVSTRMPTALFSHSDQASQWQSGVLNGVTSTGWGGRLADLVQPYNSGSSFPPVAITSSCGIFCTGQHVLPATVPPAATLNTPGVGMATFDANRTPAIAAALQQLLTFDNGLQLVQADNDVMSRGDRYANTMAGLLAKVTLSTQFPEKDRLAAQLQTVAKIMSVHRQLGLKRQIFFCNTGGYDTHGEQLETHHELLSSLSRSVGAFYKATEELSIAQNVTTFTASEFGRTLSPTSRLGSDHAWGSHHFIIGGGVKGGKIYGDFPHLALGGDQDAFSRGTLIPTTSVAQYGATLAQWFGVGVADMPVVFPNIRNFASPTLSFMG